MAELIFSKIKERYKDYQDYKPWLESNSHPQFCGYTWVINQTSLCIDHYKPKEHFPELEAVPDNLILCNPNSNSAKSDYHPEAKERSVYKKDEYKIFNYRQEDIGKFVKIRNDGSLTFKSHLTKDRFYFNERIFKFNQYHFQEIRKEYILILKTLIEIYHRFQNEKTQGDQTALAEIKADLDKIKEMCSKRYIFYKLLNIKIPRKIEKLLTNYTKARFVS